MSPNSRKGLALVGKETTEETFEVLAVLAVYKKAEAEAVPVETIRSSLGGKAGLRHGAH